MLLGELARDNEDWFEPLGMSERLAPSLPPRTRRVPFALGKEE